VTTGRAKRENGGLGEDPPGSTITYLQVVRTWLFSQGSDGAYRDSGPSEARKRGSGGGSPRKYDNLPTGPSDLDSVKTPPS
jgi:hypothetical protein